MDGQDLKIDSDAGFLVWPSVLRIAQKQAAKGELSLNLYTWIKFRLRSGLLQIMLNTLSILWTLAVNAPQKVSAAAPRAHLLRACHAFCDGSGRCSLPGLASEQEPTLDNVPLEHGRQAGPCSTNFTL